MYTIHSLYSWELKRGSFCLCLLAYCAISAQVFFSASLVALVWVLMTRDSVSQLGNKMSTFLYLLDYSFQGPTQKVISDSLEVSIL